MLTFPQDTALKLPCDLVFTGGRLTLTEQLSKDARCVTYAAYDAEQEQFCAVRVYRGTHDTEVSTAAKPIWHGDTLGLPLAVLRTAQTYCAVFPLRQPQADEAPPPSTHGEINTEQEPQTTGGEETPQEEIVQIVPPPVISNIFSLRHSEALQGVSFMADNFYMAVAAATGELHICAPHPRQVILSHTLPFRIKAMAFSSQDNALIVAAEDRGTLMIHPRSGAFSPYLSASEDGAFLRFSHDGSTVALAATAVKAALYDARSKNRLLAFAHQAPLTAVAPGQALLVSAAADGTAYVTSAVTQKLEADLSSLHQGHIIQALALSPDNTAVATAATDGYVYVTNLTDFRISATVRFNSSATAVAFAPHAAILASGSRDGSLCFTDTQRDTPLTVIDTGASVTQIAFSPDGNLLAALLADGHVRVYDTAALGK